MQSLDQEVQNLVDHIKYEELDLDVRARAATIFLHDVAIGIQGSKYRWVNRLLIDVSLAASERGGFMAHAEHSFQNTRMDPNSLLAVFHNATAMASTVLEDFYGGLHLGPVIVSTLMSVMEKCGGAHRLNATDMDQLIEATVAGYEAAIAVHRKLGTYIAQRGIRGTPILGVIGACYAAGKLLNFNRYDMARVLSLPCSTMLMPGYELSSGYDSWIYQAGLAAQSAILSLYVGRNLVAPNEAPLESLRQYLTSTQAEKDEASEEPLVPSHRSILDVGVKRQPVNIYVQSAVEAALKLKREDINALNEWHGIDVSISTDIPISPVLLASDPLKHPLQSVLSIPLAVAAAVNKVPFTFESLTDANQPDVVGFARGVHVKPDLSITGYGCLLEAMVGQNPIRSSVENSVFYPSFADEVLWLQNKGWFAEVLENAWGRAMLKWMGYV